MNTAEKLQTIAENEQKVFNAGYEKGKAEGGGTDTYYNEFWGLYQDNGNRVDYFRAFGGCGWNDNTFKPKYSIRPNTANNMFSDSDITNLKELLNNQGVELDFSGITSDRISQVFSDSTITDIGVLDISSCKSLGYFLWRASALVNVDKVILSSNGNATFTNNTFSALGNLVEIRFEGVIGQNGFNMQSSQKLSHDSLISIINALQDKTTDTSGTEWKIKIGSGNLSKLTTEEINIAEMKGWAIE